MSLPYSILVLEDAELDYALLERHFRGTGFNAVLTRAETREQFEKELSETWDAVLSDYNVPGFGAVPALEILKKRGVDIPLIVLSGEIGEEKAVEIMRAGAEDFVKKDNLARLIPALERSIRASELRKRKVKLRIAHEQALQDRERLMDVVCHDIKNPLSSVRLVCQLLLEKAKESDTLDSKWVREIGETILRSSERVNLLVHDLLEQSRIESGLFGVKLKAVSIQAFLKDVFDAFDPIARNKDVTLRLDPDSHSHQGYFDRDRIFQVMSNLVSNALKFSPPKGEIVIGSKLTEDGITFFVRDQGPGIAASDSHLIFSKFFQGKSHKFKGHGLGLWIAHEIIKAHRGNIHFRPSETGMGTTFFFSLPTLHENSRTAKVPETISQTPRLFIVDDDPDLTETLCRVLKDKNIECQVSPDVDTAVDHLSTHDWNENDILLIDYDLPGKNGGELVAWLRMNNKSKGMPKIVLMSAHPDIDERAKALELTHYLRKPMHLDEVFGLLKNRDGSSSLLR